MGFVETVKNFVGIDTEDYEDDDYEVENAMEERTTSSPFSRKNKVVPINGQNAQSKIVVLKPRSFSNANEIADELKSRRPVVFDVGVLEPEEARRVVDYIAGVTYGIDGDVKRVSGGIFIAVPSQIDISGKEIDDQVKGSFEWNII